MATPKFAPKDPNDIIDEKFDWSTFLAASETLTSATVTVAPSGELLVVSTTHDDSAVTFHVSGGVIGTTYEITCQVQTSAGNTVNRKATIAVKDL